MQEVLYDKMCFILNPGKLRETWARLVRNADHAYVVVAWAQQGWPLNQLLLHGVPTTAIVGTSFNGTAPGALQQLAGLGDVFTIDPTAGGLFHPKLYLFHNGTRFDLIIGSPNLNEAAFTTQTEVAVHLSLTAEDARPLLDYIKEQRDRGSAYPGDGRLPAPADRDDDRSRAIRAALPRLGGGVLVRSRPFDVYRLADGSLVWFKYSKLAPKHRHYWFGPRPRSLHELPRLGVTHAAFLMGDCGLVKLPTRVLLGVTRRAYSTTDQHGRLEHYIITITPPPHLRMVARERGNTGISVADCFIPLDAMQ